MLRGLILSHEFHVTYIKLSSNLTVNMSVHYIN